MREVVSESGTERLWERDCERERERETLRERDCERETVRKRLIDSEWETVYYHAERL